MAERRITMQGASLPAVTDLAGMAEILMVEASSLAKVWRDWPHFFVGKGRTARGARFRPDDVLEYLERNNGNYSLHDQERQAVQGRGLPTRSEDRIKVGVHESAGRKKVGSKGSRSSRKADPDRYGLLTAGNGVP